MTVRDTIRSLSIFASVVLVFGCEKVEVDGDAVLIEVSRPNTVLARIDGEDITCADFIRRLDFETELFRRMRDPKTCDTNRVARFRLERFPKVLPTLINAVLLERAARDSGVSLTSEELDAGVSKLARAGKFKGDPRTFAGQLGVDYDYCANAAGQYQLIQKVRDKLYPGASVVTSNEVDEGLERLAVYFRNATVSNQVTSLTCSNVLSRIRLGEDFCKLAGSFSIRGEEESENWGEFLRNELEDKKLREWAFSAPTNSIAVFDLDDGLAIVKILERSNIGDSDEEAVVKLGRILFEMMEPEPEPRTREHVERELRKWKRNEAQKALFDDLMKKHPIVYPNGNSFKLRKD